MMYLYFQFVLRKLHFVNQLNVNLFVWNRTKSQAYLGCKVLFQTKRFEIEQSVLFSKRIEDKDTISPGGDASGSIASQYRDMQLKMILQLLPLLTFCAPSKQILSCSSLSVERYTLWASEERNGWRCSSDSKRGMNWLRRRGREREKKKDGLEMAFMVQFPFPLLQQLWSKNCV